MKLPPFAPPPLPSHREAASFFSQVPDRELTLRALARNRKRRRYPRVISSPRGHSWAARSVITPADLSALEPERR